MLRRILWPSLLLLVLSAPVQTAVDLVTVPTREGTRLTIYNSEDITMVREQRLLTVKQGVNRIQFAWANTLIDPTSSVTCGGSSATCPTGRLGPIRFSDRFSGQGI